MTLFLTSSPSGCPFEPGPDIPVLDTRNHFVANLRAVWPDHAVLGLAIAADPYAYEQNDEMCRVFAQSFANAHLPLTALIPCDARNAEEIGSLLPQSGFVMLCGGHVPTQNHFFAQLGLPGLFHNYHGIVLGVSAGSMNAALADAISVLPEQTREEILRYYFLRQPQRVIGACIGRSRSTAGRHIQLALQRLREEMGVSRYE